MITRMRAFSKRRAAEAPPGTENAPLDSVSSPTPNRKQRLAQLRRLLFVYLAPSLRYLVALWVLTLVGTGIGLISPYLTRPLMDTVLQPAPHTVVLPVSQRASLLIWIVLGMLLCQVASRIVGVIQQLVSVRLTTGIVQDLRLALVEKIQILPLSFLDKEPTGNLMSRILQDTESLQGVLTGTVTSLLSGVFTLVGSSVVLIRMNAPLLAIALLPLGGTIYLTKKLMPRSVELWKKQLAVRGDVNAVLQEGLSGVRVVRAFAQETREVSRFRESTVAAIEATLAATRFNAFRSIPTGLLGGAGTLLIWWIGGEEVLSGHLTLGMLTVFISYLGMLQGPIGMLINLPESVARGMAAGDRVFEILDAPTLVPEPENPVDIGRVEGRLDISEATFGYASDLPVLHNITLHVKPGEMIGLVGHSGAGKSTLINLLLRFYDVWDGAIRLDGVDLRDISTQALRRQIGVVLQEPFLFSGTIAENIAYARPDATREEIIEAAKAANAHEFICAKPEGYDSLVGERGVQLSGGERQRISIARALIHDPRILILDEATSAVDAETEYQIQEALLRLIKGRTTFAIAHRLSTLRHADRLVVLRKGQIVEIGTHDELMEERGEYHHLVTLQQRMNQPSPTADIIGVGG